MYRMQNIEFMYRMQNIELFRTQIMGYLKCSFNISKFVILNVGSFNEMKWNI